MQLELPVARPTGSTDSTSSTESSCSTSSSSSAESSVPSQAAERPLNVLGDGKTSTSKPKGRGSGGVIIPAPRNFLPPAVPHNIVFVGCPLCLEPAIQPCVTRCGHVFCGPCIAEALDAKANCPVCRVEAKPKHLRKIFLSSPASAPEA